MINTYVINLDSRPDNWSDIKKHFKGTNFKLTRIPAVIKNVGAYGTFLSFIKALKLAKKKGLSEILILEDDCLPVKGFEKRWETIKDWLDKNLSSMAKEILEREIKNKLKTNRDV